MATKTVTLSDLSGAVIDDDQHVSIVVRDHPAIEGPVRLDASESEVSALEDANSDFVIVELHTQSETTTRVIELSKFEKLFKGDAQEALENAERVQDEPTRRRGRPRGSSGGRTSGGSRPKRDREQVQAIREWARANGWPDLGDRGRIPIAAEEAYHKANG